MATFSREKVAENNSNRHVPKIFPKCTLKSERQKKKVLNKKGPFVVGNYLLSKIRYIQHLFRQSNFLKFKWGNSCLKKSILIV